MRLNNGTKQIQKNKWVLSRYRKIDAFSESGEGSQVRDHFIMVETTSLLMKIFGFCRTSTSLYSSNINKEVT